MKEKFYFSARKAAVELRRRQDLGMKDVVEKWWKSKGWPFPCLPDGKLGILARHIATSRYEDLVFMEMASSVSLQPLWIEYTSDKFVSSSSFKKSLVHLFFCSGKGRGNGWRIKKEKLACVVFCDGKRISDIKVGEISLVEYHHSLQAKFIPGAVRKDLSDVYSEFGGASYYYPAYLSLFVAHGVLFEDYHGGESGARLNSFTEKVFQPAWELVYNELGLKPLIVSLPWWDGMQYYPANHDWLNHGVFNRQLIEEAIV